MNYYNRLKIKILSLFIPDGPFGDRKRGLLYEPFLKSCGKNFKLAAQAFIYNPEGLSVGDNVYIGFNSYIGEGNVTLGDEVLIGNFVSITASNHIRANGKSYRFGGVKKKDIVIEKGSWLAANSCVLAGVNIGENCLVAAGSVVTKSTEKNSVYAGIPAKKIG